MRRGFASLLIGLAAMIAPAGLALAAEESRPAPSAAAQSPQPPQDSPRLVHTIELRFPNQGGVSMVQAETYLYYMEIKSQVSRPSEGVWIPYTDEIEEIVVEDFRRLWNTNFLDDLWIEVEDDPFENGVEGVRIIFNLEERQRVKVVRYTGSESIDRGEIEEKLQGAGLEIRLDTFIDLRMVSRVEAALRQLFSDGGYQFAEVTHEITSVAGGPKLVHLTFNIDEGPKVEIKKIEFVGNRAMSGGTLKRKMKGTKERWWLSWISGRGTYQPAKFEEDAVSIMGHYRDKGYIAAQVGQPEVHYLELSSDGKTRGVRLRIPVSEGERYRIGNVTFDGNTVVESDGLQVLFEAEPGEFYSEKRVREGLDKARELYGRLGYYEFTGFPDLVPRDLDATANGNDNGGGSAPARRRLEPIVDVTVRLQEGMQYFVNRITFVGNKTTHDEVIRREVRLVENGVFDTEALKYSIRRLNQLGYFEPLDLEGGEGVSVEKAGQENEVDVTLTLNEQNLNQVTFGAGVSQWYGFFGQLSFQTSNFLGRGEALSIMAQSGSRSKNYMLTFTKPFMFGRPVSGAFSVFKRDIRFIGSYTESSAGTSATVGFPIADFTRVFMGYSLEQVHVTEVNQVFFLSPFFLRNPFLQDALLLGQAGKRTISKITPTIMHDTVDHPIFPTSGRRYSTGIELAGLGGNTRFYKPSVEGVWYMRHTSRTSIGLRAQLQTITAYGGTEVLPIFERLWLGGEYSVRGYDIRTIGPRAPFSGFVIGGNKSALFNAEYLITVASPVRLVLYYDAGQVRAERQDFRMDEFKTSTGLEVRFMMPILNVPFRLIYAHNPQREGVLTNRFRPAPKNTFRFAVGTTF